MENYVAIEWIYSRRRRGWQDEMVGWHHQLDGQESEQSLGIGDGQGSLACCMQSMGSQSQTRLSNWTELIANMAQRFLNGSSWPLKHSGVKHSNTCEVQNLCIIYSWLSVSEVSHPPIQPSLDWVVPQYIFLEKDLYVSGPTQFKPVIFKDQ